MVAVKKAVSKVLHPKRELRERRRRRRENDDDSGDEEDEDGPSRDGTTISSGSSSSSSTGSRDDDRPRIKSPSLQESSLSSDEEPEMFEDAQEPDGAMREYAAIVPDKGQDGIQDIAEPATSTSKSRSSAAHPNGRDPAPAVELKPTDRHYLNKALVQSV